MENSEIPVHMTYLGLERSCAILLLGNRNSKAHIGPIEPCLNYEGKWRNVCLSCGRVEIDGVWLTLRELQ